MIHELVARGIVSGRGYQIIHGLVGSIIVSGRGIPDDPWTGG